MGSFLDGLMSEAVAPVLFESMGSSLLATYDDSSGTTVDVTVIVLHRGTNEQPFERGIELVDEMHIMVLRDASDVNYGGIARPRTMATLTIDSTVWTIAQIMNQTSTTSKLRITSNRQKEIGRSNFRGP